MVGRGLTLGTTVGLAEELGAVDMVGTFDFSTEVDGRLLKLGLRLGRKLDGIKVSTWIKVGPKLGVKLNVG